MIVLVAAFATYWFGFRKTDKGPEASPPAPIALKKHSELFNKSVDSIVSEYLVIKNAFVEADSAAVKNATRNFVALLNRFPIDELKKDTAAIIETVKGNVMDIKSNAESILNQTDITEMRHDFSMVTEMMYPSFFTAINYEGQKLFVQKCPMAFGDDMSANWISDSRAIVNPYLGKTHPKYKATMLDCGDVVDSVMAK